MYHTYDQLQLRIVQFYFKRKDTNLCLLIRNNIFRILIQYIPNMSRDFKNRIKLSLKAGHIISADLNPMTKRSIIYRKSENTHSTPLKDEHANLKYVIVMLTAEHNGLVHLQKGLKRRIGPLLIATGTGLGQVEDLPYVFSHNIISTLIDDM